MIGAFLLSWAVPFSAPSMGIFWAVGGLTVVGGLLFGGWAALHMLGAHTSPDPDKPTMALVTADPFRLTRNPMYVGFFLIYLGFTFGTGTLWGILLSPFLLATVSLAIIRLEEAYLEDRFGDRYPDYRSRLRRWL
jgi:protein-S-isoprenylcysteine O-methyltransferase Ste14